jgi:hypothetical protein
MTKKFHERFELDLGIDEAKRRFVNRVLNFLLDDIRNIACEEYGPNGWAPLGRHICSKLGERWSGPNCLSSVFKSDFEKCLQAIEALYAHPNYADRANGGITSILQDTEIDIGIRWEKGRFLPSGASVLDEKLVNDVLGILSSSQYKGVSDPFKKGLDHFLHSTKKPALLADVLTDMHEALEALAKIICGKDRDLSPNRESFVSELKLADSYKRMLKEYIGYANDFARHAGPGGKQKPLPSRKEVEGFMYLTGLFIRLALSKEA